MLVLQTAELIAKHAQGKFDPDSMHNQHNEALRELSGKKAKRKQDVIETGGGVSDDDSTESETAETVDLMRMLKQSLKAG